MLSFHMHKREKRNDCRSGEGKGLGLGFEDALVKGNGSEFEKMMVLKGEGMGS